jgi:hypothetical protein
MKKRFLFIFAIIIALSVSAQKKKTEAQSSSFRSEQWLKDGNFLVNIGIGLGSPYSPRGFGIGVPPVSLSADYLISIPNDPLKGKLGIGGLIGYGSSWYRSHYNGPGVKYNYTWRYSYYLLGARINYHILLEKKVDIYLGIMAALRISSYRFDSDFDGFNESWATRPYVGGWFVPGFYVGCRYFFQKNIAVFGEVGYNVSWLTAGISFKF